MLKPRSAVAAVLSALAISLLGAQVAMAAEPGAPWPAPRSGEHPTPSPRPSAGGPGEHDLEGMDHDMPGMDHGDTTDPGHDDPFATAHDHHGDDHGEGGSPSTAAAGEAGESHAHAEATISEPPPVAALVGGFALLNGAVMVSAAVVRRRDKRLHARSPRPTRPAKS